MSITKTKLVTNSELEPIDIEVQQIEYDKEMLLLGQVQRPDPLKTKQPRK